MMEFGISDTPIPKPRRFDKVDTLTGTPDADTFEVDAPGFGTLNDLDRISVIDFFGQLGLQSLDDNFIAMGIDRADNLISTFDVTADSEEDILVYQEQERANYLEGFQAPTARSYTYIEDFDLLADEILVDGGRGHVKIMSDENDIPMLTDDIQSASRIFGM